MLFTYLPDGHQVLCGKSNQWSRMNKMFFHMSRQVMQRTIIIEDDKIAGVVCCVNPCKISSLRLENIRYVSINSNSFILIPRRKKKSFHWSTFQWDRCELVKSIRLEGLINSCKTLTAWELKTGKPSERIAGCCHALAETFHPSMSRRRSIV